MASIHARALEPPVWWSAVGTVRGGVARPFCQRVPELFWTTISRYIPFITFIYSENPENMDRIPPPFCLPSAGYPLTVRARQRKSRRANSQSGIYICKGLQRTTAATLQSCRTFFPHPRDNISLRPARHHYQYGTLTLLACRSKEIVAVRTRDIV